MATRFLYTDWWKTGVCTASSTEPLYSPESTKNPLRAFPWRSEVSGTHQYITCDFGVSRTINAVALVSPLLTGDLTGVFQLSSSVDCVSPFSWNTGWSFVQAGSALPLVLTRTKVLTLWLPTPFSMRCLRVDFFPISGSGAVEIGSIIAGSFFEPAYSVDVGGFSIDRQDLSAIVKGRSGAISRTRYGQYEKFPLTFQAMPDVAGFRTMFETLGIGGHFVMAVDHADLNYTWYGYFESSMVTPATEDPSAWDVQLQFSEAL